MVEDVLMPTIGVFTGKHGPHSMAQAKAGRFWFTNALSSTTICGGEVLSCRLGPDMGAHRAGHAQAPAAAPAPASPACTPP